MVSTQRVEEAVGKGNCTFYHTVKKERLNVCVRHLYIWVLQEGGLVSWQIGSMEVRSEAQKKPLATNCVFLSAEGCSEGIEGSVGGGRRWGIGGRERRREEKKPSAKPSSWTLNFTVVAAFLCLSFWCYLQSKGSKAWSVAWGSPKLLACQPVIYAKVYAKRERAGQRERERGREQKKKRGSLHGMWLNSMFCV